MQNAAVPRPCSAVLKRTRHLPEDMPWRGVGWHRPGRYYVELAALVMTGEEERVLFTSSYRSPHLFHK